MIEHCNVNTTHLGEAQRAISDLEQQARQAARNAPGDVTTAFWNRVARDCRNLSLELQHLRLTILGPPL